MGILSRGNPPFIKLEGGTGPRYLTIQPNGKFAYVVQELSNQVTAFNYKKGPLAAIKSISILPVDFK